MDTESNFLDGIKSAWLGEQYSAAFFNALADNTSDDSLKSCWHTLAQLETATGRRMADLLANHGESPNTDEIIEISDEMLHEYTAQSHEDAMHHMKPTIEKAIARYDQLLAVAPENDVPAVQFLVDHEIALLHFVECELSGNHEQALDSVKRLLSG